MIDGPLNEVSEIYELKPFESTMVGGVWVVRLPGGWGMYIKGQMLFVEYSEEFKPFSSTTGK